MAYEDLPAPIALHLSDFQYRRETQPVWQDEKTGIWHIYRYSDAMRVLTDARNIGAAARSGSYGSAFGGISQPPIVTQRRTIVRNLDLVRPFLSEALTPRAILQMQPYIEHTAGELVDSLLPAGKMEVMSQLAWPLATSVLGEFLGITAEDREEIEVEGERLTDDEVATSCHYFMTAARATLSHTLGNTLLLLSTQPDVLKRLRQLPPPLYSAVEETLRYLPSVWTVHRTVIAPVALGGQNLPRGADVCVSLVSANHDPEQFDHPERLDIDRIPNRHLTFGDGGTFSCPVGGLTRLVVRLTLAALAQRTTGFEVAPGDAVEVASPREPGEPHGRGDAPDEPQSGERKLAGKGVPDRCSLEKLAIVFEARDREGMPRIR
jgi:cytochrome P450